MDARFLRLPTFRWGVIDDARRRQRRRRTSVALAVVAVLIVAAIVLARPAPEPPAPPATAPPARLVGWKTVLTRAPYMGISCSVPNSTVCDRVGLAVWVRRPAVAMHATLFGQRFALDDRHWSGPRRARGRKMFAGFLHRPGLEGKLGVPARWEGDPPAYAMVVLRIDYASGGPVETHLRLPLRPGWG